MAKDIMENVGFLQIIDLPGRPDEAAGDEEMQRNKARAAHQFMRCSR